MASKLPKADFKSDKVYLCTGAFLNAILTGILERTPLVQAPLTSSQETTGVMIGADTLTIKVCVENEGGGLEEQEAVVLAQPVGSAE